MSVHCSGNWADLWTELIDRYVFTNDCQDDIIWCVHFVGERYVHYYSKESVGIAVGLFLSALTNVGLFSLTSTPLNAGTAICKLLNRPPNERVFVLMPVGFPAQNATVPFRKLTGVNAIRKSLTEICKIYD